MPILQVSRLRLREVQECVHAPQLGVKTRLRLLQWDTCAHTPTAFQGAS